MRRLMQWLCGYVCICLNGHHISRFLNLCSRNGIHLWHICYDLEHKVRVSLKLKDFYFLKPFLRKTKTKLRIIQRHGFPFWCHRHPRLKWFFLLCLICFGLFIYSFSYIWNIEISGNEKISSSAIITCLEQENITIGQKANEINCSKLEYSLRQKFHDIGWVSVYVEHRKLYIVIKESLYDEYVFEEKDSLQYDFISNKDAKIYSIVTRQGKALVKKGDTVKKGETLVRGQYDIFNDIGEIKEVKSVKADALIWADVTYDVLFKISEIEMAALKISGLYSQDALNILGNEKVLQFIEILEKNGVIILDKDVMIDINESEKSIYISGKIYAREIIGTNVQAEEVDIHEFE